MRYFFTKAKTFNISLILFLIFLSVMCKNPISEEETSLLNKTLDSMVNEQYLFLKSIEENDYFYKVDSVYYQGNSIISENEKGHNCQKAFVEYCHEFGNKEFILEDVSRINNLKSRIRMIQLHYFNFYLKNFIQSYFQVDLIGFIPIKKEINKNKKEVIEIFPTYINRTDTPIVLINYDTLEYTVNSYLFKCYYEKSGEYLIEPEAIVKRWGDTEKYKSGFKIIVK